MIRGEKDNYLLSTSLTFLHLVKKNTRIPRRQLFRFDGNFEGKSIRHERSKAEKP